MPVVSALDSLVPLVSQMPLVPSVPWATLVLVSSVHQSSAISVIHMAIYLSTYLLTYPCTYLTINLPSHLVAVMS